MSKKGGSESDLRDLAIDVLKYFRCRIDESTIEIVVDRLRERKKESLRRKEEFLRRKKAGKIKLNFTKAEVEREEQNEPPIPPDIAPPDNGETWEMQSAFVTAWFFEMWERLEAGNKKASREARAELQSFLIKSLGQSLRVALDDKDSTAKQWACKLLGDIFFSISKYVGKVKIEKRFYRELMKNPAFRDEKERIRKLRPDVLHAGVVLSIVKRELKTAERYRKHLKCLSSINNRNIPQAERQRLGLLKDLKEAAEKKHIPAVYLPLVDFPEFYSETKEQWWKFLWELIKMNNPDFIQKSRNGAFPGARGIRVNARWATYRPEFRNAFNTLARLARLRSAVGWP